MPPSPFVTEATRENFNQLVLGNSDKGPVMVHFWTPKAGPCMLLNPRLIKLTTEYGGKCLLVLANTDELGQIAHQYAVTSVPTVRRIDADPADLEARYQLAAAQLIVDDLESAMAQMLEIAQHDRGFRHDIGRRGLVALFDMLGTEHVLTQRYRPLLVSALN